ncbi:hypothetical protein O9929_07845 [Vibrio lentus]|nr:hypothetical protein [Vibrio lentus]
MNLHLVSKAQAAELLGTMQAWLQHRISVSLLDDAELAPYRC